MTRPLLALSDIARAYPARRSMRWPPLGLSHVTLGPISHSYIAPETGIMRGEVRCLGGISGSEEERTSSVVRQIAGRRLEGNDVVLPPLIIRRKSARHLRN